MAETTETLLDTTPNKKWSLIAVRKETKNTVTDSSVSFKITDGTISDCPVVKRVDRQWKICYNSPQVIPKYVRLFVAKYFARWFSPMQLTDFPEK